MKNQNSVKVTCNGGFWSFYDKPYGFIFCSIKKIQRCFAGHERCFACFFCLGASSQGGKIYADILDEQCSSADRTRNMERLYGNNYRNSSSECYRYHCKHTCF